MHLLLHKSELFMLQVHSLHFEYQEQNLLQDVNFDLPRGCLLHLRGGNGSGKTTMLRLLAGILSPASGQIYYDSQPITQDLKKYQKQICYVGHKSGLNALLTVRENCFFDLHKAKQNISIEDLVDVFNLRSCLDTPCYQLSAGQQKRVGLLRIVMTDSPLWLLDEPLTAMDSESITLLQEQLEAHLDNGGHIVLTSHQSLPKNLPVHQEYIL
jgi:heme exporter protein A